MCVRKMILIPILLFVLNVVGQDATIEVTFKNTTFGIFTTPNVSNSTWLAAQDSCTVWAGNLATIESLQEDTLLYYLTDVDTYYSCWIGLNDRDNEAGTNGSAFIWVDGSNSTYRQFATTPFSQPNDTDGSRDCVGFRFKNDTELSDGWNNRDCNDSAQCYFCQKSGDSRGCDLIYDGSCYRAFEVSDGINWLDAQSSCAVWGGDLTSITTERENNLLYTIVNGSGNGTWIGLYDKDGDGNFYWTEGSALNYTNWATGVNVSNNTRDCTELLTDATWNNTNCDDEKHQFICKKESNNITTIDRFGQLLNGGFAFNPLNDNTFLYESTTLVCRGDENSNPVQWLYSYSSYLSPNETLTATYMNTETGFSWLAIDMSKQGYYMCKIDDTTSYKIGFYDSTNTKVLTAGMAYNYVVGIDREEIILLCENSDSEYDLSTLLINIKDVTTFFNPINVYVWRIYFPEEVTEVFCLRDQEIMVTTYISVKGPPLMSLYNGTAHNFSSPSPIINNATVDFLTENVSLSMNVFGKWMRPDNTNYTGSQINFQIFTPMLCGVYSFVVVDLDGIENMVMKIKIEAQVIGSYLTSLSPSMEYTLQETNAIFFTNTKFVCFTTDNTYPIQWKYQATQLGEVDEITSLSVWNSTYGMSTLLVSTDQPGFYSCDVTIPIMNRTTYIVGVFDPTYTFEAINSSSYSYLIGIDAPNIQLLCTSYNTSLSLSNISWMFNGEVRDNPLIIGLLTNASNAELACYENNSELLTLRVTVQGPAIITISYNETVQTHSLIFPKINIATIPSFTDNITIASNLSSGYWITPRGVISSVSFSIPLFALIDAGYYSLYTNQTWHGQLKLAAKINIMTSGSSRYFGIQSTDESIKNGTALVLHENTTVLYCATNSNTSVIDWEYTVVDGNKTNLEQSISIFDDETGIGSLLVNSTQPGYYGCVINGTLSYQTLVVPSESIVELEDLLNNSKRNFTTGSTHAVIYFKNANSPVPDSSIHWTTDSIQTGENKTYKNEYNNPVNLQMVFSNVGTGVVEITSFYRNSPATVIGALKLALKDDVTITVTYPVSVSELFSDLSNSLFPLPQQLNVTILTKNITLTCSLDNCTWNIQQNYMSMDQMTFESSQYNIATLMMEDDAVYSLQRMTSSGKVYNTASIHIHVTGAYVQQINNVQTMTINQSTILIRWNLTVTPITDSNETFYIYYGLYNQINYAGSTNNLSCILTNLSAGKVYKFYIALTYAFSNKMYKTDIHQFKINSLIVSQNRYGLNTPGIAALCIIGFTVLLGAGALIIFFVLYCLKKCGVDLTRTTSWFQESVRFTTHPRVGNDYPADAYIITSSECESAHIIINDTSFQEGNYRRNEQHAIRSVEETEFVDQREAEGDCMYFANISQLEDTVNEIDLTIIEDEKEPDIQLEVVSNYNEMEDKNIESLSQNSEKDTINDTYNALNDTYEIQPTETVNAENNTKNTGTDVSKLEKEFELLNAESISPVFKSAESEVNSMILESPHFEGYTVDASYLCGGQFIATVHPIRRRNLLQLVYQNNCSLIVMLTTRDEQQDILAKASNYVRYWPVEDNAIDPTADPKALIDQEISLQHSKDNTTLSFRHIIFSGWNEDGSIEDVQNLVLLLQTIKKQIQNNPFKPVIIHCNDGLTKTGVLLACYTAIQELEANKCYSMRDIVKGLRMERINMLPTLASYVACCRLVEEFSHLINDVS